MENQLQRTYLFGILVETLKTYGLSALLAYGILLFASFYVNNSLLYYVGGILFLTSVLSPVVTMWRRKERIAVDGKAILISGCDRGFGFMLAQRLDDIGFHVFAGCLFPDGPGAESLRKSGSKRLHVVGLDVTSDTSIQKSVTYIAENLGDNLLWGIVNNAGIIEGGELSWISMESIQKTIDVNTLGVVHLTKAFLLKLKESKGRVVSIASVAGRYSVPSIVPYSMSKSAVISFCDGLRREMYKWNIQVITIEPAVYSTPMLNKEEVGENYRKAWAEAPQKVRDSHGSEYMAKTLKTYFDCISYSVRHPREVVSVMEEALTALYPEYHYAPGSFIIWYIYWIGKKVPKPISDMVLFYLYPQDVCN